jgi:hypothetical protein
MSAPEELLALQLRAVGIPFEREVVLPELKPRRWRWDFVIGRLLIEVHGGTWIQGKHSRGPGQHNDAEKQNSATVAGYSVLTVMPVHIKGGQALAWIEAMVRRAHGA